MSQMHNLFALFQRVRQFRRIVHQMSANCRLLLSVFRNENADKLNNGDEFEVFGNQKLKWYRGIVTQIMRFGPGVFARTRIWILYYDCDKEDRDDLSKHRRSIILPFSASKVDHAVSQDVFWDNERVFDSLRSVKMAGSGRKFCRCMWANEINLPLQPAGNANDCGVIVRLYVWAIVCSLPGPHKNMSSLKRATKTGRNTTETFNNFMESAQTNIGGIIGREIWARERMAVTLYIRERNDSYVYHSSEIFGFVSDWTESIDRTNSRQSRISAVRYMYIWQFCTPQCSKKGIIVE